MRPVHKIAVSAAFSAALLVSGAGAAMAAAPHPAPAKEHTAAALIQPISSTRTPAAVIQPNAFVTMTDQVTAKVHAQHPHAALVAVHGRASHATKDVNDITQWRYVFTDEDSSGHQQVVVATVDAHTSAITVKTPRATHHHRDAEALKPVAMTPQSADQLLQQWLGQHPSYGTTFTSVTLRQSASGDAAFVFTVKAPNGATHRIAVDTATHQVTVLR
ncbi:hypothetical protein ACIRS1_05240 [Kitasatospora sp. NPDC101176]|uniref:hypothetical protein n=1 Tax=Kitasatospora sp. NPDC101176 TaxID=3364099 RepID=UPI00380302C0